MTAGEIHSAALSEALATHGLILRGGFHPQASEKEFEGVETVLLVGNAGGTMWGAFAPHFDGAEHPLNRWTERVIEPIAARFSARAVYPFGEPRRPFQQWAMRAETLYPSPIGLLIHPQYGLWHAWRAALLFVARMPLPPPKPAQNPCEVCAGKPCLSACPVSAFGVGGFDVARCAGHLAAAEGERADCHDVGCHARNVCPVGVEWRYPEAQVRFHIRAFARSVAGANATVED
jgi:hypothetical protein